MNKFYLFASCLFLGTFAKSQVLIDEDFTGTTGTTPPAGWTNNDIAGDGEVWAFDNPGFRTLDAPISDPAAIFDSDIYGNNGTAEEAALESVTFDASGTGFYILTFDHYFYDNFTASHWYVEVFDGTTWNLVDDGATDFSGVVSANYDITSATGGSTAARVRMRYTGDWSYYWIVDNIKVERVDCIAPSNIQFSNITSSTIDVNWTANGAATSWNIEYGPAGFSPGSGTADVATTNSYTMGSLTATTAYDFYIQSDCGGGSLGSWQGPFSITSCENNALCIQYASAGDIPTEFNSTPTVNSTNSCPITLSASIPAGFMISTVDVEYSMTASDYYYAFMSEQHSMLYIPASGVGEGTLANGVGDYPGTYDYDRNNLTFAAQQTGNVDFELRAWHEYGDPGCDVLYNYIEANTLKMIVRYEPVASCLSPMLITASNITDTDASIDWNPSGSETEWNIEYGPAGFTPGTGAGTIVNVTSPPPFALNTLMPNTEYDVYLQADCGGGDMSAWSPGYANFTTECAPFVAPFSESFSNGILPDCWSNASSNPDPYYGLWVFSASPDYGAYDNGRPAGTFAWTDGSTPEVADITLTSPMIDISTLNTPTLVFDVFSNNVDFPDDNCVLDVEVNDGSGWTNVFTYSDDSSDWVTKTVDLSAFSGQTIQVRFIVDQTTTTNSAYYNDILLDEVKVLDCALMAGTGGSAQVCRDEDAFDLNSAVTIEDQNGAWSLATNPFAVYNDSLFNTTILPSGTVEALYIVSNVCTSDTVVAMLELVEPASAGQGSTVSTCNYGPFNLVDALSGVVDLDGQWYDSQWNPISGSLITFNGELAGNYNFHYIVDNGVCDPDTALVELQLQDCLGLDETSLDGFKLYPNPSGGLVYISYDGTMEAVVRVSDLKGAEVLSENVTFQAGKSFTIDLSAAQPGVYLVRIAGESGIKVLRVVKN